MGSNEAEAVLAQAYPNSNQVCGELIAPLITCLPVVGCHGGCLMAMRLLSSVPIGQRTLVRQLGVVAGKTYRSCDCQLRFIREQDGVCEAGVHAALEFSI